jgi:hypothetical protein
VLTRLAIVALAAFAAACQTANPVQIPCPRPVAYWPEPLTPDQDYLDQARAVRGEYPLVGTRLNDLERYCYAVYKAGE